MVKKTHKSILLGEIGFLGPFLFLKEGGGGENVHVLEKKSYNIIPNNTSYLFHTG